jgi:hypothetical protein
MYVCMYVFMYVRTYATDIPYNAKKAAENRKCLIFHALSRHVIKCQV